MKELDKDDMKKRLCLIIMEAIFLIDLFIKQ